MKMIPAIRRNPAFHANWAALLAWYIDSPVEVSIVGVNNTELLAGFSGHYLPQVIFSGNRESFETGHTAGKTLILICHKKTCFTPVETVAEAIRLIESL
jgi:uncharacterized protein YyaL (SSP411 family)